MVKQQGKKPEPGMMVRKKATSEKQQQ